MVVYDMAGGEVVGSPHSTFEILTKTFLELVNITFKFGCLITNYVSNSQHN
jgi:hypothetical protein